MPENKTATVVITISKENVVSYKDTVNINYYNALKLYQSSLIDGNGNVKAMFVDNFSLIK